MKTYRPLTVDTCPDARDYSTIRFADGSEHGNIEDWPIATVYAEEYANVLAAAPELYEALRVVQTALVNLQQKCDEYDTYLVDGIPVPLQDAAEAASPALVRGAAALAKVEGR